MNFENMCIKSVEYISHFVPGKKKWRAENRKHHFVGIMLGGAARHDFDNQSFVLSRNCIYFFNQRDNYSVEVLEPGDSLSVHFTTYEEIDTDSFCIPVKRPDEFVSLLLKLERLQHTAESNSLALRSVLYALCDAIAQMRKREYFPSDTRMHTAKAYIDTHFQDANCLSCAVAQSGVSARRFNDLFKTHFDMTPNRYLTHRRVESAKRMLETQSLTVSEIAELCGFSDVYYFSKVFRQLCGVPPSKWS